MWFRKNGGKRLSLENITMMRAAVSIVVIGCIVAGGIMVVFNVADYQRDQYFDMRKFQAAAAVAGLNYRDVQALKGDERDIGTRSFEKLRAQLKRIKETDSRIRFVYLMRPRGDNLIFLVDAEDTDSKDYSPPGQVYEEAVPGDFYAFEGKEAPEPITEGPVTDRWGTWISSSAYVLNEKGEPIALLGTDVDVKEALGSFNRVKQMGIVFVAVLSFLLALLALIWVVWSYRRDRREHDRRRMEEDMLRLNRELLEADRMKSDFIESASHELRGPVAAVKGALEAMEKRLDERERGVNRELLAVLKNGARRLEELAINLTDMAQIEAGNLKIEPRDIDVAKIARETTRLFKPMASSKDLELVMDIPDEKVGIFADPDAVRRILENLLSNAVKYTDSGSVTVKVEPGELAVTLTVGDTGNGIAEEYRSVVFEKFSRLHLVTDSNRRGAGLGLAICKGLVDAHGGRISFESGEGTSFRVELPIGPGGVEEGEPPG